MSRWLCAFLFVLPAELAAADPHPDFGRYAYAVIDYRGDEPTGAEKRNWQCYDALLEASISCAFISGTLSGFKHIYRFKKFAVLDPGLCTDMWLEIGRADYEMARIRYDDPSGEGTCEGDIRIGSKQVPWLQHKIKSMERRVASGCKSDYSDIAWYKQMLSDHTDSLVERRGECRREEQARKRQEEDEQELDVDTTTSDSGSFPTYIPPMRTPAIPGGNQPTITGTQFGDQRPPDFDSGVRTAK